MARLMCGIERSLSNPHGAAAMDGAVRAGLWALAVDSRTSLVSGKTELRLWMYQLCQLITVLFWTRHLSDLGLSVCISKLIMYS